MQNQSKREILSTPKWKSLCKHKFDRMLLNKIVVIF